MFSNSDVAEVRHVVQRILVPCIFVIGLLGNSVSIYVLTRKRMRCTTNIYLTALAITDIIYLTMVLLLSLKHYDYIKRNCEIFYIVLGVIMWLVDACAYISIYIAVCFTIERFIAIRYPLKRQTFCTESLAKKVIAGVTLFCLFSTISTAFEHTYIVKTISIDSDGNECNQTLANLPIMQNTATANATTLTARERDTRTIDYASLLPTPAMSMSHAEEPIAGSGYGPVPAALASNAQHLLVISEPQYIVRSTALRRPSIDVDVSVSIERVTTPMQLDLRQPLRKVVDIPSIVTATTLSYDRRKHKLDDAATATAATTSTTLWLSNVLPTIPTTPRTTLTPTPTPTPTTFETTSKGHLKRRHADNKHNAMDTTGQASSVTLSSTADTLANADARIAADANAVVFIVDDEDDVGIPIDRNTMLASGNFWPAMSQLHSSTQEIVEHLEYDNSTFAFNVTEYCQNVSIFVNSVSSFGENKLYIHIWSLFTLFVFVLIPLCVLATFNCFLIMLVRRSKSLRGDLTNASSMRRVKRKSTTGLSSVSQENRVTVTLIAVVLLFIICQLPWAIYLLIMLKYEIDDNLRAIIGNIFNLLAAINAAANFFLYCVLSDKYRKTVRELITGYRRHGRHSANNTSLYTNTSSSYVNGSRKYRSTASTRTVKFNKT